MKYCGYLTNLWRNILVMYSWVCAVKKSNEYTFVKLYSLVLF